ncbi:MAG: hypothetical protein JG766_6 [Desulfacinum sp.]|nr:hypothetical protein [Desulfacinum sp.]
MENDPSRNRAMISGEPPSKTATGWSVLGRIRAHIPAAFPPPRTSRKTISASSRLWDTDRLETASCSISWIAKTFTSKQFPCCWRNNSTPVTRDSVSEALMMNNTKGLPISSSPKWCVSPDLSHVVLPVPPRIRLISAFQCSTSSAVMMSTPPPWNWPVTASRVSSMEPSTSR